MPSKSGLFALLIVGWRRSRHSVHGVARQISARSACYGLIRLADRYRNGKAFAV